MITPAYGDTGNEEPESIHNYNSVRSLLHPHTPSIFSSLLLTHFSTSGNSACAYSSRPESHTPKTRAISSVKMDHHGETVAFV